VTGTGRFAGPISTESELMLRNEGQVQPAGRRSRRLGRALAGVVAAVAVLVGAAAAFDGYAGAAVYEAYAAPGEFVTVNGARMYYVCDGAGEPTLVLSAGIGGGALDWSPLLPLLAERNRVCAFDRFGQDYSDGPPLPRGRFAASLEAMARRHAGATFVRVADARHYVQADQPEAVAQALRDWLDGLAPPAERRGGGADEI
jgi:hypothetical protein